MRILKAHVEGKIEW